MAEQTSPAGLGASRLHVPGLDLPVPWPGLGRRAEGVAAVLLASLIAAFAGNAYLAQTTSPAGTLRAYLVAQSRGDADGMWTLMAVSAAPPSADLSLLSRTNLRAMLADSDTRIPFTGLATSVPGTSDAGAEVSVDAVYRTSAGLQRSSYRLRRRGEVDPYARWAVVVTPAALVVNLPTAAGDLVIDGQSLAVKRAVAQTIAVFPGRHRVSLVASALLAAETQFVDASDGSALDVTFDAKLTPGAEDAARSQLRSLFAACAAATEPAPAACPQSYTGAANAQDFKWQLLGDPAADATFSGSSHLLSAGGHFQMLLTYFDPAVNGNQHVAVGGGFRADFQLAADAVHAQAIVAASSVPPLTRPAEVTDEAVKDIVRQVFATCVAATVLAPPDCPGYRDPGTQYGFKFVNVTWSLVGDQLAKAHVSFDGNSGLFVVTGPLSMQIHYDRILLAQMHMDASVDGTFTASVIWNQGKPLASGIVGNS